MAVVALQESRRSDISPFYVMEVMRAAEEREAAGGEVLHLEVGQPSTPAPAGVIRAAKAALESDVLGYTTAAGLEPLRRRISEHYQSWYDVDIDPGRIVVTFGASGAFVLSFLAAFDAGDRVVVSSPGYPCYRNALQALNAEVVTLPTSAETRFQPSPDLLEDLVRRTGSVDGLVLASPSNPSGTMLDGPALAAVSDWCTAHGVRLVADEIYHGITFSDPAPTALGLNSDALVVNSFSKYFSMTGWRLGWVVAPDDLVEPVRRLAQNFFISAPTLSQIAAVAAFDCHEELQANVARYAANRSVLVEGLPAAGIDRLAPSDGAFYVYAAVDHLATDSQALCRRWLDELGVAVTPGVDFDRAEGHRYARFSYAGATEDMAEAMRRLREWGG
ncbi:MAG: pyridoxal phosphate-dependent aminotransferase [Acidimicrobiaceae bacterium]|nr:pyridoxal phosphate-dependent aminotransferase [Acidimicrobiaceae bacterium]MYE10040.1 pyridoxal phosphate-dependent aminotransferase [Acidimicrobiaceae bacterium]MYI36882.1 pyridoxal phosphate-dependent aminotransferase [Acidimicrobiaceae bacterium]